jgi:hypothetical protein
MTSTRGVRDSIRPNSRSTTRSTRPACDDAGFPATASSSVRNSLRVCSSAVDSQSSIGDTSGAYGALAAPKYTHRPQRTVHPSSSAFAQVSLSNLVLPTPGSPCTNHAHGR